jgi:GGDEF domain-containing protein
MRTLVALLIFLLTLGVTHAQEFANPFGKGVQPILSQPLEWVSALSADAPSLPSAFSANPETWIFAPYLTKKALPTTAGRDVWLKFSLAATAAPQSWIIRIPRLTVRKIHLYDLDVSALRPVQSAGIAIPHSAWSRSTRTPSFDVVTSNVEKTFFLRFEHHSPIPERPELMTQSDFTDGSERVGILIGLLLGMFGMLMIACVATFSVARNTVFLSLSAFVATTLVHYLVLTGYGGWRIWPDNAYVTQAMQWSAPLLNMSACCWFFAQASRASDISKSAYRLLGLVAVACLGLAVVRLINMDLIERSFFSYWAMFVLFIVIAVMLWLSARGMRGSLWLLAGLSPMAAAGASRLAYNAGWLPSIEFTLVASVFLTQIGLVWLFVALIWRNRASLLSSELAAALNDSDAATGLITERVTLTRLPQMLMRATRLELGCGVIMLRWLNYPQLMSTLSPEAQKAMLKYVGLVLNRVARDIDTAARLEGGHFMLLVEGPTSRSTLSSLSTQVLTACIRASDKFGQPSPFNFHIAIWQATLVPTSADEVMEALKTRLNQMSFDSKRPVQFVDSAASDIAGEANHDLTQRRDDVIAKIDAIEASPSVRAVLMPEQLEK